MVTRGEVAAAFFFIDPLTSHPHSADIRALTRICEVHNIASATNPSTGAALVFAFLNNPEHKTALHLDHECVESKCVEAYKANQKKVIEMVARKD
jgi:methylglyoxal synthase